MIVRVHPMSGEISRYSVSSSDPNDDPEEEIVQTSRIPGRIVQTSEPPLISDLFDHSLIFFVAVQQYGLFKFRTGNDSRPATPTAAAKSRAHIFSLDAISRNLFNTRPGSSKTDLFGTSVGGHRRTKSSASRSSTYTQTTTTADGSLAKFSYRSGSTNTAATSLISGDDDKSSTSRKMLFKRGRSPGSGRSSPQPLSSISRSSSYEQFDDGYDEDKTDEHVILDRSDPDLTMRLELARRNSQSQHGKYIPPATMEKTVESTIYEGMLTSPFWLQESIVTYAEEPPLQLRPMSRASTTKENSLSSSRQASSSPARGLAMPSQPDTQRSVEPRRFGPRSPSPLPPASPVIPSRQELSSAEVGDDESFSFQDLEQSALDDASPSPLPRSKRQAFGPFSQMDSTPKATNGAATPLSNIEPLSIKKKSSTRSGHGSYTPTRKYRASPLSKTTGRVVSPRKVSPQTSKPPRSSFSHLTTEYIENIIQVVVSARDEVCPAPVCIALHSLTTHLG